MSLKNRLRPPLFRHVFGMAVATCFGHGIQHIYTKAGEVGFLASERYLVFKGLSAMPKKSSKQLKKKNAQTISKQRRTKWICWLRVARNIEKYFAFKGLSAMPNFQRKLCLDFLGDFLGITLKPLKTRYRYTT